MEGIISDTAKAISTLPVEPQLRTNQLGSLSGTHRNTVTAQMTKSAVQNVFRTAATQKVLPQHVNLTKEDSKLLHDEHFAKLLNKQKDEFEKQYIATEQKVGTPIH